MDLFYLCLGNDLSAAVQSLPCWVTEYLYLTVLEAPLTCNCLIPAVAQDKVCKTTAHTQVAIVLSAAYQQVWRFYAAFKAENIHAVGAAFNSS